MVKTVAKSARPIERKKVRIVCIRRTPRREQPATVNLEKQWGDRHRCPRAVEDMWIIRDYGGLGQRCLSPHCFWSQTPARKPGSFPSSPSYTDWSHDPRGCRGHGNV